MAKKAYGTTVKLATSANGTYTDVTGIIEVTLPTISKDTIESNNYNTDGIKKYRGGLVDTGELGFTTLGYINGNPFEDLLKNDTEIFVQYSTPDDSTKFQASGIVTGVESIFDKEDVLKMEIIIKLTSNITQIG